MKPPACVSRSLACFIVGLVLTGTLRAQLTEVPYTVAPGAVLLEADVLSLDADRRHTGDGEVEYSAVGVGSTFVTTGVTERLDVQVGVTLYLSEKYTSGSGRERHSGVGDVFLRSKLMVWQHGTGGAALAVMPYVKLPTGSGRIGSDAVEGGLIVPWSVNTLGGFDVGAMFQWDLVRDSADVGYDGRWAVSAMAGRALTATLAFYGEATLGVASAGDERTSGTLGVGVTWVMRRGLSWDLAVNRGYTSGANDWQRVARLNWSF